MNRIKKCTAVVLIIGIMIGPCLGTSFAIESRQNQFKENYKTIEEIIIWKKSTIDLTQDENLFQDPFLQNAGNTSGDWYAISLGRLGYQDDYIAHRAILEDQIIQRYKTEGKLDALKATEWHRIGLALLSLGGDPTDVGSEQDSNGIDLIADGSYDRGKTISLGTQGINGWSWGLTLLDSMRYEIPKDAHTTRETIIEEIFVLATFGWWFCITSRKQ